ncbi:NFX1-type zinc finger-containing protein 1-like [Dysidea avara]|uniref:NFX1-type zinc finger-containing protein 1-like n=1 Tax=Dysidea avara TaxID=196820 RepID=UPI00331DC171
MASGGYYPDVYSSVSSRRGGRGGGRSSHFGSRGQGKKISHRQRNTTQSMESDYFPYDEQSTGTDNVTSFLHGSAIISGGSLHEHRGRGGKFRGRGRASRRPYGTRQRSHVNDQPNRGIGLFAGSATVDNGNSSTGVGNYRNSVSSAQVHQFNERKMRGQRPVTYKSHSNLREEQKFKRTTIPQFLQLYDEEPDTIAVELLHDLKSFQKVILNSERVGERKDDMLKIVVILIKLTMVHDLDKKDKANRILAETFNSRSCKFFIKLQQYIHTVRSEQEFFSVVRLFDHVLKLSPSCWELLPVEPLKMAISNCRPEIVDDSLYLSMDTSYQDAQQNACSQDDKLVSAVEDYSEYKHLSILPGANEINEMFPPKLRRNIVEGHYDSWEHYYDTQFKLLKEDFVAPLRRGVCGFRDGLRGRDISDIRVYYGVAFAGLSFSAEGILLTIRFDSSRFHRVNWEHSKRLIYGSLLCFSCNNFETVIFASVVERDAQKLKQGEFTVKMESHTDVLRLTSNKDDLYTMIESQAHYETYYHILNSLQKAEFNTMPFTEILIESKCQEVEPPAYMCLNPASNINHPQLVFNMKSALGINEKCSEFHSFDVSRPNCWPSVEHVQLDESQLKAMKMALTQKVSVIQGPPGTGKTYIGMKIVQALLTNRHVWDSARNSPLLVVCYTNHALDQFLEGIINMDDSSVNTNSDNKSKLFSIVRVGGRCQNEKVAKYSIKNVELRKPRVPREVHFETRDMKEIVKETGTELDEKFQIIQQRLRPHHCTLVEFIAPFHKEQLHVQRINLREHLRMSYQRVKHQETYYSDYSVARGLQEWLSCKDLQKPVVNNGVDINTTEVASESSDSESDQNEVKFTDRTNEVFTDNPNMLNDKDVVNELHKRKVVARDDDNPETTDSDISGSDTSEDEGKENSETEEDKHFDNAEDTVNVIGEAELAGNQRMIDHPADVFHYEGSGTEDEEMIVEGEDPNANFVTEGFPSFPKGPFTHAIVSTIDDIFRLTKHDRYRLYDYWKAQYIEKLHNQLRADFEEYSAECKQYKAATQEEDFYVLEKVDMIRMTTTGAAKYQHIIQRVKPKIVVVEEAAEVLESHIVSCLTAATQQLILIGDHKQLRPNPNEFYLASKYDLDVSLFERLIKVGIHHATLEIQHRMRPEIAGLVCPYIYPKLLNHESVLNYEDVRGITTNMYFFDHKYPEQENDDLRSHCNEEEAKLVVALCNYFLKQDYSPSQITVLTTYTGQVLKLKSLMPRSKFEGVRITAVDNFQGEENDIILLSLVRSNENGRVGFLKIENRICVALSRAKKGFYCFGNFSLLRESCDTWKDILQYLGQKSNLGSSLLLHCSNHTNVKTEIHTVDDFQKVPEGGCNRMCDARLECGHVCKLHCHPRDPFHNDYECRQPCAKSCENDHRCPNLCNERCPSCTVKVEKEMPKCGHKQSVPCHLDPRIFQCKAPCAKKCPQGHLCPKLCSDFCGKCTTIVQKLHPKCGHLQSTYCHQDPRFCQCQHPCEKLCSTNPTDPHKCKKFCYQPCGYCLVPVLKTLPKCGHEDLVECYRNPLFHSCLHPCEKKLSCGHPCTSKCGEQCTAYCKVEVLKKFSKCGHFKSLPCGEDINAVLCEVEVNKKFPGCEHFIVLPCSKPINDVYCQEQVHRTLPCGHGTFMKCSKSPVNFKCKTHVKKTLRCGHIFEGKCCKADEHCTKLSNKTFPMCGHKVKLPCCEDLPPKCTEKCTTKLLCGHRCTGDCTECHQGRMHKPCSFNMFSLPCGHPSKDPCVSVTFPSCDYKCEYSCVHRKVCTHNCSQPCNPCKEPCSWKCPHYKCSKKCHEICDRPRCNHPCKHTLQCKHPCIGVCGEPCPRVCRICKKQKKRFHKLCVGLCDTKNETRYIQLSCDHLFEVKMLDQLLDEQFKEYNTIIQPLVCPSCRKQIHSMYRYGDIVKRRKEIIERLQATMNKTADDKQRDVVIDKILSSFVPYFYHEEGTSASVLRRKAKSLPPVFKKASETLTSSDLSVRSLGILENEIDQYTILEKFTSLCEQFPDLQSSLKELLSFFEKTPPSVQKSNDVSCERQRIFLLLIITNLQSKISSTNKDFLAMQQLQEALRFNQPKLTLTTATKHYDDLQKVTKSSGKSITLPEQLQSNKAVFFSGIWIICPNIHIYCKPRGLLVSEEDKWLCPECAK